MTELPSPIPTRQAIFFVSDGMRPDLLERYAADGEMPVLAELLARGAVGEGGCVPPLPTNTGAGWATLATGAWSGTSGSLNNTYHRTDTPITQPASGFDSSQVMAETLAQAAERQGLRTAAIEWPGSLPATVAGPVIDFRIFYAARGAVCIVDPPDYDGALAARLGLADQRCSFQPASGWRNVPPSLLPPYEGRVAVTTARPAENPDRAYQLYVYATTPAGYDRVLVATAKDGAEATCDLSQGEWGEARVRLRDGREAGFHFKLIELQPDLSQLWLAFTTLSRARAHPPELEDLLASPAFPVPSTADHAPIEAGLIDADTYVEQGLLYYANAERILRHLVETYHPDLLLLGAPVTDEFSHQFLARVTPAYPGYDATTAPRFERYLRAAYAGADRLLGYARSLFPAGTTVAVSSDHGFSAAWRSINANLALERAGLLATGADGKPLASSLAVAYWVGGTCNVYVNLAGRQPGGIVPAHQYEAVCRAIEHAFWALNENIAGAAEGPPIERVLRYAETDRIPTSAGPASMQYPGRIGDVVVFSRPPYQFDAPTPECLVAPSPLLGQHGYLPDTVDERYNANLRSPFILSGRGIVAGTQIAGARAIDLAPTLAAAMGIAPPANADGRALHEALLPGVVAAPST